jgi:glutamate-ammonia-ligase adenylyltransferase
MESEHGPDLVADLILDPTMPQELIEKALAPYQFKDHKAAIKLLGYMAREEKPYFSTPRCRHFFAALAPKLVSCISRTINPDRTLNNLETIARPIPGKVALWERLLRSSKALDSLVEIAAYKKLTMDYLTASPDAWEAWSNSIDQSFPSGTRQIDTELQKNTIAPGIDASLLKSIRDQNWLAISSGLKLPISAEDTIAATKAIADLASSLITMAARQIWSELIQRWRVNISENQMPGKWAVIALGKLGGAELLFHSDLDLLFLHEINPELKSEKLKQSAESFFQEIASKLIRKMGESGNATVYRIDTRLRPFGNSGPLTVSIASLDAYYSGSEARVWEKLALLRARPVVLNGFDENEMVSMLNRLSFAREIDRKLFDSEIQSLRRKTINESDSTGNDLKRVSGGLHELELIVQGLQLSGFQFLIEPPSNRLIEAIDQLHRIHLISESELKVLKETYLFYRQIELSLRLLRNRGTNSIEIQPDEISLLEKMISDSSASAEMSLIDKISFHRNRIRKIFQERFSSDGPPKVSATI